MRSVPPTVARVAGAALLAVVMASGCGDDGGGTEAVGSSGREMAAEIVAVGDPDEGIDGVEAFRIESDDHTTADVQYSVDPPPGGPHHPVWANCGFHDQPVTDEHVVHSLEHGAVWLAYSPDLAAADVDALRALAAEHDKVIASPFEGLAEGEAVVASAWARQLRLGSVEDPRLARFVAQYVDGDQAPEAGATCSGTDVGRPLG